MDWFGILFGLQPKENGAGCNDFKVECLLA